MNPLRILLLCHSFNSLTQRLFAELRAAGHSVSVELDIAERVTEEALALFAPDLLLAPFLRRRLPASVWQRLPCLVLHPGPPGDRGPSALDWALLHAQTDWGVTVLQANDDLDAGPVWAQARFPLRAASKGSVYRREVTQAALQAVNEAVARFASGARAAPAWSGPAPPPHWQPLLRQSERAIDWAEDSSATVLAKIRSADGQPGVLDTLWGQPCYLSDAHLASPAGLAAFTDAAPGALLAVRDGALLRRTRDAGVWIGQARLVGADGQKTFKQAAASLFAEATALPLRPVPLQRAADEWGELRYTEHGPAHARVGCLSFDFYNGAMSTARCERLHAALLQVLQRPTKVLLLLGGEDFFSNGIDLNSIEAAAQRDGDSAADASWRNINAMNDLALAILHISDRLSVAVLRGNAGAGGAFLALAADQAWAHDGVVLNPHYKNMGNLYGSEYWTYLLPRRLGEAGAHALMAQRLPLLARCALQCGLIDRCDAAPEGFAARCLQHALALACSADWPARLAAKQAQRQQDEAQRPLADYRAQELARMQRNFYGFDPSYHVARHHFVYKQAHAWTPRHLAVHR
ncbi:enoyl-CoA hydratase-related protein [Hydrogenophaga sp.]|uniref:enoyl-CoA hydratase-related protein n=1 Tax=Hydrogenophaga sp. TaxID=1904254 RepID=UPI00344CB0F9